MVTASEELASPNWFSARTRVLYSLFSSTLWPDTVMYSVPFPEYGNGPRVAGATPSASSDTEKLSGKHVDGLWSGLHAVQHHRRCCFRSSHDNQNIMVENQCHAIAKVNACIHLKRKRDSGSLIEGDCSAIDHHSPRNCTNIHVNTFDILI